MDYSKLSRVADSFSKSDAKENKMYTLDQIIKRAKSENRTVSDYLKYFESFKDGAENVTDQFPKGIGSFYKKGDYLMVHIPSGFFHHLCDEQDQALEKDYNYIGCCAGPELSTDVWELYKQK